jgi:uncharacterized lipoprotein YddW (UPF0748 family)
MFLQMYCKAMAHAGAALVALALAGCASGPAPRPPAEVRGTWLTTTANTAIASQANSAATMQKLADIGLNTVYVEVWKNGYTQFPSEVLRRTVGVPQRPGNTAMDPSDSAAARAAPPRDLLQETLIEAHRNGLIYVAWFEYGFMAAHKSLSSRLREQKPQWLSRDINGNDIAPNGFVWMNPLHPEARRFLLDIVLEAIDKYDLDGIQLDDRIVWPYINMGYDDFTRSVYAAEHGGRQPPADHTDPAWMRWRADKVNEYAKWFVQEVRAARPGLVISLSPAVYPWSWEHYLLEWPKWGAWTANDRVQHLPTQSAASKNITPRWDEFIPQAYRFSYEAFEKTWKEQTESMQKLGANRQRDLIAGLRLVGDGKDSTWEQLRDSMSFAQQSGNGGHVHWYSRGVLDIFPRELKTYYAERGRAVSPHFAANWRRKSIPLFREPVLRAGATNDAWVAIDVPRGKYRMIGFDGKRWQYVDDGNINVQSAFSGRAVIFVASHFVDAELIVDRREEMMRGRKE